MSQNKYTAILTGILCAVVCEIIFGFSFYFTKSAVQQYQAFDLLAWRFGLAALLFLTGRFTGLLKIRIEKRHRLPLLALALLFPCGYFISEAYGVRITTSSEVGLIIAAVPAITLALNFIIRKERPDLLQSCGIFISIAGVVSCVLAKGFESSFHIGGYLLIFLAITFYCLYIVLAKSIPDCSDLSKTYAILVTAGIFYTGLASISALINGRFSELVIMPFVHHDFAVSVLYLSVMCSCVALFLCNCGVSRIGATRFSSFIGIETLVAIMAGIVLLHEDFNLWQMIGGILILSGVYLANSKYSFKRKEPLP